MKLKNEIGNVYGRLTVIKRAENHGGTAYWTCQCECGNIKDISGNSLRSGRATSCGCSKRKDYSGQKFGKLTAIAFDHVANGKTYWKFKCDCGNEIVGRIDAAVQGDLKSCQQCLSTRIIDETGHKYGNLTVLSIAGSNANGNTMWNCVCDCGNHCIVSGSSLRSGATTSCGCIVSKGEQYITKILEQHNISFKTEQTFDDLINPNTGYLLRYDFSIYNNEKLVGLIEYNGSQHYQQTGQIWGHGIEYVKEHDRLKTEYAKTKNIPLLIIKYTEYDNLENIISEYLKKLEVL